MEHKRYLYSESPERECCNILSEILGYKCETTDLRHVGVFFNEEPYIDIVFAANVPYVVHNTERIPWKNLETLFNEEYTNKDKFIVSRAISVI